MNELSVANWPERQRAAAGPRNDTRPNTRQNGGLIRLAAALAGGAFAAYALGDIRERLPLALVGGVLLYRGVNAGKPAHIEHTLTIKVEPGELYAFWRDFRNLPIFMRHLKEVRLIDRQRSHWVANAPAGMAVEWDAEIFMEKPGELIAWRSLPGAQVANAGSVRFSPAPGGGTTLRVVIEYLPPAGALGRALARLFGEEPSQQVSDDLRRLKVMIEGNDSA